MSEVVIQVGSFLTQVLTIGGGAAAIAYFLFVKLGEKWMEERFSRRLEAYKAEQVRELESYKYEINSLFNRITKIHDKEIEVLPNAWQKLQEALAEIQSLTAPLQSYPNLDFYSPAQLEEFLSGSKLRESHREEIRDAKKKTESYQKINFWYRLTDAYKAFQDFHNYVRYNRIFLHADLFSRFKQIDDLLYHSLVDSEVGKEAEEYKMIRDAYKRTKEEVEPLVDEIEKLVQQRLHYPET